MSTATDRRSVPTATMYVQLQTSWLGHPPPPSPLRPLRFAFRSQDRPRSLPTYAAIPYSIHDPRAPASLTVARASLELAKLSYFAIILYTGLCKNAQMGP